MEHARPSLASSFRDTFFIVIDTDDRCRGSSLLESALPCSFDYICYWPWSETHWLGILTIWTCRDESYSGLLTTSQFQSEWSGDDGMEEKQFCQSSGVDGLGYCVQYLSWKPVDLLSPNFISEVRDPCCTVPSSRNISYCIISFSHYQIKVIIDIFWIARRKNFL